MYRKELAVDAHRILSWRVEHTRSHNNERGHRESLGIDRGVTWHTLPPVDNLGQTNKRYLCLGLLRLLSFVQSTALLPRPLCALAGKKSPL